MLTLDINKRISTKEILDASIIQTQLYSSLTLTSKERAYLDELLGKKGKRLAFNIYRGSVDGFMYVDFHSRCDGFGPTVSLFRVKQNQHWIGGYTTVQWKSCDDWEWHSDKEAFLFSLTQQRHFPVINHTDAVYCGRDRGQWFGYGELAALFEPFNTEDGCVSETGEDVYNIGKSTEGVNELTQTVNDYDRNFTIDELEVWQVAPI